MDGLLITTEIGLEPSDNSISFSIQFNTISGFLTDLSHCTLIQFEFSSFLDSQILFASLCKHTKCFKSGKIFLQAMSIFFSSESL